MSIGRRNPYKALLAGIRPPDLATLTTLFREQNYDMQTTADGRTTLAAIRTWSPDFILLGADLLATDGRAFIRQARTDHQHGDLPIIGIVPPGDWNGGARILAAGGTDYVVSPIQRDELLSRIATRLSLKELREQPASRHDQLTHAHFFNATAPDGAGVLLVMLDGKGRILRFNRACEGTTGYSQQQVAGKHVWDLFLTPKEAQQAQVAYAQGQPCGPPDTFESRWITRDGQQRLINWSSVTLHDEQGRLAYVVNAGIDVTEQRPAKEALSKLSFDLGERVKELQCLYALSALVEKPGITLTEILQGTVNLVQQAFRTPEDTCVRIILDGQVIGTENFHETRWQETIEIRTAGRPAGRLQVCILAAGDDGDQEFFLEEEKILIGAVAQRLGKISERMQTQEAQRYSQEQHALYQQAANIGSWDWEIATGDLHWSAQIEPLFGFGAGEFGATYEAFLESIHPEDRDYVSAAIEGCVRRQSDLAIEHRIVWPCGTVRWVSETGNIICDTNGQAVRMFGVIQDITEHKQAEAQIRQHNAFLTTILESLTHPFYVVQIADHTVEMANSAARLSDSPEPAKCYTLLHKQRMPCPQAGLSCPLDEVKQTKRPAVIEHTHFDADGKEKNTEVRCYPLFDDNGQVVRVIEYCLDITQRKQAEKALRESEARWRSVTQSSPDHVILLDHDLNIQFVNHASPGLTIQELVGTPLWSCVSQERQSEIKGLLEGVLTTGEPCSYNSQYFTPDGGIVFYESRVVARTKDDQIVGLAVNARDITDHERTEQALREAKELAEQARREEQERRREAERRRRIAESLADVLVALNSDQPLKQILDYIAVQARQALDNQAVAICQLQGETGELAVQATHGLLAGLVADADQTPGMALLRQAIASHHVIAVPDLTAETPFTRPDMEVQVSDLPRVDLFRALLAVPTIVQDKVYGGLLLYYAHPHQFTDEELAVAAMFGEQVVLAIENAQLREQVRQAAVAAERSRLARDLHDSVTQALFSASLVAEVLPQVWQRDPDQAWEGIEELRQLTRGALAEMRTLLLELRPTALGKTRLEDLLAQLTEAVTIRGQIAIDTQIEPSPPLPLTVHVTLYRVAQEALHNVVKHAGASQVTVSLAASPPADSHDTGNWQGRIVLCVSDNGRGFDRQRVSPGQLGLDIMQERATTVGGELTLESQPDQGTRVIFSWETPP